MILLHSYINFSFYLVCATLTEQFVAKQSRILREIFRDNPYPSKVYNSENFSQMYFVCPDFVSFWYVTTREKPKSFRRETFSYRSFFSSTSIQRCTIYFKRWISFWPNLQWILQRYSVVGVSGTRITWEGEREKWDKKDLFSFPYVYVTSSLPLLWRKQTQHTTWKVNLRDPHIKHTIASFAYKFQVV